MAEDRHSAEQKGEYDYEGDMAKSQLKSIITNAQRMHDMLEETTNLPEWVQSKITLAEDYILTATSYMEGEMSEEYSIQERINMAKAKMGDVIKDFKASDAPQFAGRSEEERRKMAVAAKLEAMRKSKMSEELKGNQHKIDANKNNKIDAHDFKLLRSKLKAKQGEAQNVGETVIAPRPSIRNNNDMRTNLKPKKPKPYSTPSKDNNHNQPRGTSADVAPNKKRIPLKQKPTSYSTPSKHNQPRGTSDVKNRLIGLRKEEVEQVDEGIGPIVSRVKTRVKKFIKDYKNYYDPQRATQKDYREDPVKAAAARKNFFEDSKQVNEILPFLAGALARGAAARLGASAATRAATGKAASSAARVASYRGRVNVDGGGEEDNGEYEDPRGSVVQRYTSPDMDDTEQEPDNYSTAAAREADRVRKMQNQNRNLRKTTTEEVELDEAPYMGKGNHKPGWMLRADPELDDKFKKIEARRKRMDSLMKTYGGKTGDEIAKMKKEEVDLDEAQLAHKVMYAMKDPKKGGKIAVAHYEKEEDAKKFLDDIKKKGGHGIIRKNEPKNEEVEQVNELKKSTLGSYIKKASSSAVINTRTAAAARNTKPTVYSSSTGDFEHRPDPQPYEKKVSKRLAGISKAVNKMNKEEVEQVDEVIGNTTGYSDSGPRNKADERKFHQMRNVVTKGPRTGKITRSAQNRLKARLKDKTYMDK